MTDKTADMSKACPICGKPPEAGERPFCSRRCREVDLHRWLGGHYAIPVAEEPATDDEDSGRTDMRIPTGQSDSDCL